MKHLKYSLLAAAGILILAFVLTAVGPKRVMAALGYTPVRDVDNPGRQPFQITLNTKPPFNSFTMGGKRLVIDRISGFLFFTASAPNYLSVRTTVNGSAANHYLRISFVNGGAGSSFYNVTDGAGIYADPNTILSVSLGTNGGDDVADEITISGHLVDMP